MKFKLGDTVRVTTPADSRFDKVGRVTAISKEDAHKSYPFGISGIDPWMLCYGPHELILAEPPHVHEMLNDPEGQQLVQAIHDRKEKTL